MTRRRISTELQGISSWARQLGGWLWHPLPRRAYLLLVPICLSALVIVRTGSTEPAIRLTGLVLQLLGIGTVIWGIQATRRLFNHPTLLSLVGEWVKQRPRYRGKISIAAPSTGRLGMLGGKGRGHIRSNPPANATTAQRLDSLEDNVDLVHKRISGVVQELDEVERAQTYALNQEQHHREHEDEQLNRKLEALGTGGFHISAIGATWLFVGVILSTASPQLAEWLQ